MKAKVVGVIIGLVVVGAAAWAVMSGTYVGQGERCCIYHVRWSTRRNA